jgi:uncharacterized protein (DUF736 family)
MSNFTHKPGNGAFFKNENKTQPNQPDYNGTATATDGTLLEAAAWIKQTAKGKKYLSFTFKAAEVKTQPAAEKTPVEADDMPF